MHSAFKEKKGFRLLEDEKVVKPVFSSSNYAQNIEIKKLNVEDVKEVLKLLHKALFEVTEDEVRSIIISGLSFGAFVDRMLVGVGLGWPACFNPDSKQVENGAPNAIYLEDVALLLSYEGSGVRRMLLQAREEEGRRVGFIYAVAIIFQDIQKDNIEDYIKERGSALEKLYLSEGYQFISTKKKMLVFKHL